MKLSLLVEFLYRKEFRAMVSLPSDFFGAYS